MKNNLIGVFDSGIGGLTVLDKLKEVLPLEDYIFYADSKNNPYGEKSDEELINITSDIVDYLIDRNCKIIVIACNTATTRCISYLRDKYEEMTFVGTEPAIKVACDRDYKNILVMATPATISSERTSLLVDNNKKEYENVYLASCEGLAHAIEEDDDKTINDIISNLYNEYKDKEIDSIVLGCTHYPHIKNIINKYFKDVDLIDGSLGVAKEVKRQLESKDLLNDRGTCSVDFVQTK